MDGYKAENEIWNWFFTNGYGAMRAGASGGRTNNPLPDVLGMCHGVKFAMEIKSTSKKYARFDLSDYRELVAFSVRTNSIPVFVGRFSRDVNWYCMLAPDVEREFDYENSNSFSMKREDRKDYLTLQSIVSDAKGAELLGIDQMNEFHFYPRLTPNE